MGIVYAIIDRLFSVFMWLLMTPAAFYAALAFYVVFIIFALVASFKCDFWKIGRVA